jgi:hypothetical protein
VKVGNLALSKELMQENFLSAHGSLHTRKNESWLLGYAASPKMSPAFGRARTVIKLLLQCLKSKRRGNKR